MTKSQDNNEPDKETDEEQQQQLLLEILAPITASEQFRDGLLRFLDSLLVQYLGIIVLLLIVVSGAMMVFFMLGWHTLCPKNEPSCPIQNTMVNVSIQILCGLFTYQAIVSMPWRCVQFLHVTGWSCPNRSNDLGCNVYGIPNDPDIWCHIPLRRRLGILILLLLNCVTQFINQGTRIYYASYEASQTTAGKIWTNTFFVAAFLCAGIAAGWTLYEEGKVREAHPNQFGPGLIDSIKQTIQDYKSGIVESKSEDEETGDNDQEDTDNNTQQQLQQDTRSSVLPKSAFQRRRAARQSRISKVRHHPDPTRSKSRRAAVGAGESRASQRLFAF